jgi:DNA primase catalytic core
MAYIKRETIEKVQDQSILVEDIQDYVPLKKSGAQYKGKSPFVNEKSGSFMVSPGKGIWKCFSSGKGGTNAIQFLMAQGNSFTEAIKILAKKYQIDIAYEDSESAKEYLKKEQKREELRPLLDLVIETLEIEFKNLPDNHSAKIEVYKKREYTQDIVEQYRIGYAPGGKFIYNLCIKAGKKQEALDLGLINKAGNDKWHERVIYPLIEKKGNSSFPVGIAGRSLNENKKYAKWLNSPESELYNKSSFWYGLEKAREEISKKEEVWIVEGYNDLIAWQTNGIINTVAPCGTAITPTQIQFLKKLCSKVVFCFDPDKPGKEAMLKYVPLFIGKGFRVQTVTLPNKLDPDDFIRFNKGKKNPLSISDLGINPKHRVDGFKFLMDERLNGKDEYDKASETKYLAGVIAKVEDNSLRSILAGWLAKESKIGLVDIKSQIKTHLKLNSEKVQETLVPEKDGYYILPPGVKEPLEDLISIIQKYQMFISGNQIWVQQKDEPPFTFRSVSNFSVEIINHMLDEKFPMKLVRLKNIHGIERIFDMPSADMSSSMAFTKAIEGHGNFRWRGGMNNYERLKDFLFDRMGTGRKIDVLGWQPEGFWIWNNKIFDPNTAEESLIDENGVFQREEVSYYVPSANSIYRLNTYKYEAQKKVRCQDATVTFQIFCAQVIKVHRNHGMMGILFSVASMFQDIVVSEMNSFPMLFLYGPPSSGKDQLANVCQSFFGNPQTAINLESAVSTVKAHIREFAQFCNTISHLSEYKSGDSRLDGELKGFWDRLGYKRGNLDSHVGVDSIPILSSVLMTGNYEPNNDALITRFIWEIMDKTTFNDIENKEFEKLNDITKKGISSFTNGFLKHRAFVKENFKKKFREFKATLSEQRKEANSRIIDNLAVLGTFYQMFNDVMPFSFNQEQMMEHFLSTIDTQMKKLDSASINVKWWQCFLASMRGSVADQITYGRDFKLLGDELSFNFTSCFNRIQRQWSIQYGDRAPSPGIMMEKLKKDSSWIKDIKATRMAPGKKSRSTSAYIVDISKIPIRNEIQFAIDFQLNDSSLYSNPVSQRSENPENSIVKGQKDLPF